jgi:hypothetical protein
MKWTKSLLSLIGLICLCDRAGQAQVAPSGVNAAGTGSISGRVLVKGEPIARVRLALQRGSNSLAMPSAIRGESDAEGRYKFSGLAAGSYTIIPLSSVFVWGEGRPGEAANTITLGDGEQATEVDLSLKRGGVVTGKVTDADGNPVIARFVQVDRVDAPRGMPPIGFLTSVDFTTDDRGVYRYYGVPPGRYRVSCGEVEGLLRTGASGKAFPRTFHPDVSEQGLATVIEVGEGTEMTGVDIRLSPAVKTYSIAGRVVDADTNRPMTGMLVMLNLPAGDGLPLQFGAPGIAGTSGEFVLSSVRPGRWRISAESGYLGAAASGYSDPIFVEVRDENVTGVEIRVRRGGSITGVAVIEGDANIPNAPRLSDALVMAMVRPEGANPAPSSPVRPVPLAADGSFRVDGLRAGRATLMLTSTGDLGFKVTRIERNGQVMTDGIEVRAGEHLTGVRLFLSYTTASIVGHVVVTGGALPPGVTLAVIANQVGGGTLGGSARVDARGNFLIERLVPGQYELQARPMSQANPQTAVRGTPVKQTVNVAQGETTKVTLTFALKAP